MDDRAILAVEPLVRGIPPIRSRCGRRRRRPAKSHSDKGYDSLTCGVSRGGAAWTPASAWAVIAGSSNERSPG
ncbi:hypothetical protein GCM10017600_83000 [Streptosporangium carneum]|uniref:Uncharacterized protein n=1 Tax=Streptosporangium carneum TaxID=47481 RepID=A0A9W6IAN2_9ACTN|nr:hypothetical protein GCM10017600_83000 [Streptosporangium carneum]